MNKFLRYFFVFLFALSMTSFVPAEAQSPGQHISVFTSKNCGHCQDLAKFLSDRQSQGQEFTVKNYDLSDADNLKLFNSFTNKYEIAKVTPIILLGDRVIEGFNTPETTGLTIDKFLSLSPREDSFEEFMTRHETVDTITGNEVCNVGERCSDTEEVIFNLPWIGEVNPKDYSMSALSLILGFVDGFNPCAMWVLIMFITLILQAGNRRKMFELVGIFLFAEAIMYYFILNFWHKTWNFVQLDTYITPIIGVISIGAAIFFLWEFFTAKGECKVINQKTRESTMTRIKQIVSSPLTLGTLLATILLALSINIIEFACSIGIPQAFTKIIDLNNYSFIREQFYMVLYTAMYMVDDLIVFGIALYSIQRLALTTKYTRYCQLIGGLIMLILGYFLIFDPTFLKF